MFHVYDNVHFLFMNTGKNISMLYVYDNVIEMFSPMFINRR